MRYSLFIIMFTLSSCAYKGEGNYSSRGLSILQHCHLALPNMEIKNGGQDFSISNFGCRSFSGTNLFLHIVGDNDLDISELDLKVAIRVAESGTTYFYFSGYLDAARSHTLDPDLAETLPNNWIIQSNPGSHQIVYRAPYHRFRSCHKKKCTVIVEIDNASDKHEGLEYYLRLKSGWKSYND